MFIVLVNADTFRVLMMYANILGMAEGDYVFILLELAEIDWWGTYKSYLKGRLFVRMPLIPNFETKKRKNLIALTHFLYAQHLENLAF